VASFFTRRIHVVALHQNLDTILNSVRKAAAKKILYLPHAIIQMSRPDRMISSDEIEAIIWNGEVIEDYPEDNRGHSCLMLGSVERAIHVVCAPKQEYLAVITAYIPDKASWSSDFKRRVV